MSKKFAGFTTQDTVEVKAAGSSKEQRFFIPGIHAVQITAVEEKGPVQGDSTWERLNITVEAGSKKSFVTLCYPTESLNYKGESNNMLRTKLVRFGNALGYDMSLSNIKAALVAMFSDVDNLVGRELQVKFGYNKPHFRPTSNKPDTTFLLHNAKGEPESIVCDTREEIDAWATENQVKIQKWPEAIDYISAESLTAAKLPSLVKAPVAKKAF
jgi:hypothetical protein